MAQQVESAQPFVKLLVENLKALNAKERDHLMRFAYLGETSPYDGEVKRWLSPEMTSALRAKTGLDDTDATECIFASMDYHLDWVHAALKLSCLGITVSDAIKRKTPYPCDELLSCGEGDDVTLRPVSGRQEDVDLAVLFNNGEASVLLFVEAKGAASVDKNQLARKLIRLDRILASSGALDPACKLSCKFVLVAPPWTQEWPTSVMDFAIECNPRGSELHSLINSDTHKNGIGRGDINFVELAGFPRRESIGKITRLPIDNKPGEYTHWKVGKR